MPEVREQKRENNYRNNCRNSFRKECGGCAGNFLQLKEAKLDIKTRDIQPFQRKANWPRRKIWGRLPRPIHLPENLSLDVDLR